MTKFTLKNIEVTANLRVEILETNIPKPSEIVEKLSQYVVGQLEAKKSLAIAACNQEYINGYNKNDPKIKLKKNSLLLMGPSGSGKTYLIQRLGTVLKKPVLIFDITQFTQAGYVGRDVSEITETIDKEIELNNRTDLIVYIDEIDKIRNNNNDSYKSVSTYGVQRQLLKLLEDNTSNFKQDHAGHELITVNTSNVLWVLGGAFTDLIESKGKSESVVGFNQREKKGTKNITHEDLIKSGFTREFVGRMGEIVILDQLTKEDYMNLLTKPIDSILRQNELLGKLRNLDLSLTENDLKEIVDEADKLKLGARGLKSSVEKRLRDKMYI